MIPQHTVFTASCVGASMRRPVRASTSKTWRSYVGITESPGNP